MEVRQLQLHASGLDLGEVEDVVDQREEMSARGMDVLQVLLLLLVELTEHAVRQDLGEPDDGVQRRAQLVGHVREEFGLVPARDLELSALVLDLQEEPRVLDGDDPLVGECLHERHLPVGERARLDAHDIDHADGLAVAQHGHGQECPIAELESQLLRTWGRIGTRHGDVGHMDHFATQEGSSGHRLGAGGSRVGARDDLHGPRGERVMGDDAELVPIVPKRDTEEPVAQPDGVPHDRLEYLLDVRARAADHLQDLTGGRLLLVGLTQGLGDFRKRRCAGAAGRDRLERRPAFVAEFPAGASIPLALRTLHVALRGPRAEG